MLTGVVVLLAWKGWWRESFLFGVTLVAYLLKGRLTRCRVETTTGRPCLWPVRGLLGTCAYHVSYKRSLPTLIRGDGFVGLPMFMWPRDNFSKSAGPSEPQPSAGTTGAATRTRRAGYDRVMMCLAAAGVLVAAAALVRDLIAG